jgi:uncharacterized damage-inducible protein DinB
VTVDDLIAPIERTVNDLLAEIEQLPADILYREPAPGEWPVMSTLAHLAELLPHWAHEGADVARAPGKAFGRSLDDPRRVGAIAQHGHDSIADILPRIRTGLAECESTLRTIPSDAWQVVGQHPARGAMSVEQLVQAFVCNHAAEHAAQIRATLQTLRAAQSSQVP